MRIPPTVSQWAVLLGFACNVSNAQDTQFLPEITQHFGLSSNIRVLLQAKDDREGGDPQQFSFGPSVQFYLRSLQKLEDVTPFDLDEVKNRPVVFESGYRIITAPNTAATNRAIEAVTFHFPFAFQTLLSDKNRADFDWQAGAFRWRYRNRLTLQRTIPVSSYHLIGYVAAEPFYESRYKKWSTTDLYVGCLFPVDKYVQFNAYYEHENNSGNSPNRQNHFIGLALHLFFFTRGS